MTVYALDFSHQSYHKETSDNFVARIFCHWDNRIRAFLEVENIEGDGEDQRIKEISEILAILGKTFPERIRDEYINLKKPGKHAVLPILYRTKG